MVLSSAQGGPSSPPAHGKAAVLPIRVRKRPVRGGRSSWLPDGLLGSKYLIPGLSQLPGMPVASRPCYVLDVCSTSRTGARHLLIPVISA